MRIQRFTPPFTYSYQCGSFALTSYIPVYMYVVTIHMSAVLLQLIIIFMNPHHPPLWLKRLFLGISWPLAFERDNLFCEEGLKSPSENALKEQRLIKPYEIISSVINNLILLLSFGLCSPVLGCYIALSICVSLCSWLMLIGRFVFLRLPSFSSTSPSHGVPVSTISLPPSPSPPSSNPLNAAALVSSEFPPGVPQYQDRLVAILDQQLHGFHSYLLVCKWPIILTSCFFFSVICWDIAGDKVGWFSALWVPLVGVAMLVMLLAWDRVLLSGKVDFSDSLPYFFITSPPSRSSVEMVPSRLIISPHHDLSPSCSSSSFSVHTPDEVF
jgi:hypothetical protein